MKPETPIQMNAQSAVTQSDRRKQMQKLLAGLTAVTALALMLIGTSVLVQREQQTSIEAQFDIKRAFVGRVSTINQEENTFEFILASPIDPAVPIPQDVEWTVSLPPGQTFVSAQTSLACVTVDDLDVLIDFQEGVCVDIIGEQRPLVVEYVILRDHQQSMVARRVIGQR